MTSALEYANRGVAKAIQEKMSRWGSDVHLIERSYNDILIEIGDERDEVNLVINLEACNDGLEIVVEIKYCGVSDRVRFEAEEDIHTITSSSMVELRRHVERVEKSRELK